MVTEAEEVSERDVLARWKHQQDQQHQHNDYCSSLNGGGAGAGGGGGGGEQGSVSSSSTRSRGGGGRTRQRNKKSSSRSISPYQSDDSVGHTTNTNGGGDQNGNTTNGVEQQQPRPTRRIMNRRGSVGRSELRERRASQEESAAAAAAAAATKWKATTFAMQQTTTSSQQQQQQQQQQPPEKEVTTPRCEVRLLDFENLKLHGRDNELQELTAALDRTLRDDAPSEVVLILGASGTGKTSLVHDVLSKYSQNRAFCVAGKFDQNDTNVSRPYAAFLEVFSNLMQHILDHPQKDDYADRIRVALGPEAFRVTSLIPSLVDLIGEPEDDEEYHDTFRDRASLKQIFRLCREIMRQICSPDKPVILFLDDLQWGGKESLALFQTLANDERLFNFLLIGTYRDEEIAPLSIMLEEIGDLKSTLIRLSALDEEAVDDMVADLMDMNVSITKKFSTIVYRKTGGNALFICQFIDRMQELGYLQYSLKTERWGWDLPKIQSETNANDEVDAILRYRIHFLPATARTVLTRAACIGNMFDVDVLTRILGWDTTVDLEKDMCNDERTNVSPIYMRSLEVVSGQAKITTDISINCQALCKLGFLQVLHGSVYRFAHDKIHNTALDYIPPGTARNQIHWTSGQMLKRILDESDGDQGDWLFFAMVEQLNLGSTCIPDNEERIELSALNLRASYKVKETSAFFPAAGYAKEGLFLLARVEHKWEFYHGLVTKLILVMAEMAMCCGQNKDCMAATQEIIRKSRSLEEKVPAYFLRIMNFGQVSKFKAAVKEGMEVLNLLGEHFPVQSNVALVALQLAKSKSNGFGKTDDEFCELDLMTSEKHKIIMKIMAITVFYAVRGNEKTQQLVPLLFFRMFQITMKYGMCNESIVAFAGYGVLVAAILGEYEEGYRFGRLAMDLQSGLGHRNLARGSTMNYGFLHHLKYPLMETLEPLMNGFKAGMLCDETADAVNALSVYCAHYLNAGLPLEPLSLEIRGYLGLMLELERERVWQITIPYAQLMANLMGKNSQPSVLSGDVMNLKVLMDKVKKSDNINALRGIYAARMEIAYWFASYDMSIRMIQHLKELKLGIGQSLIFNYRREIFFTGLTYLAVAKNTKNNRQHIWSARECIGQMKKWVSRGSQDCEDLLLIMQAELYAVVGRKSREETEQAYHIAVTSAKGSLQNAALAAELAGSYHMSLGDHERAQYFLEQAYHAYNEWNAYKKASHLEVLYPQMFTKLSTKKKKGMRYS